MLFSLVVSRVHTVNLAKVVFVRFLNVKLLFSSLSLERSHFVQPTQKGVGNYSPPLEGSVSTEII